MQMSIVLYYWNVYSSLLHKLFVDFQWHWSVLPQVCCLYTVFTRFLCQASGGLESYLLVSVVSMKITTRYAVTF